MTDQHPLTDDALIIKAADDAGLCFPTCWSLADAEEEADDEVFATTSPEAAEIVARHRQLKADRIKQLRNFWNAAAQWGYDQRGEVNEAKLQEARDEELEACIAFVRRGPWCSEKLRTARRPKPPSLKKQALKTLEEAPGPDYPRAMTVLTAEQHALIRRALEALPDD